MTYKEAQKAKAILDGEGVPCKILKSEAAAWSGGYIVGTPHGEGGPFFDLWEVEKGAGCDEVAYGPYNDGDSGL